MKRKILILLMTFLMIATCVIACGKKEEVVVSNLTSIAVVDGSVPTQIHLGKDPDFSGIKVIATYDDGSTKELGFSDVTISTFDTTTVGNKSVTVTYEGCSTKFEVTVIDPEAAATVVSIKIVKGSIAEKYYIGQIPNYSNLQVEATYSTGRIGALPAAQYEYTPIDTTVTGKKTFTVTYKENPTLTASMEVEVLAITEMRVIGSSVKNKIFVGETLDTSKLQLLVEYADGRSEVVDAVDLMIGTIDTTTYGDKMLNVTYKGVVVQYAVEVVGAVSLKINPGSYDTTVLYGGILDTSKISGVVTYSDKDKTNKPVTSAELSVGALDTTSIGIKKLTVSYQGVSTTVDINVLGVKTIALVTNSITTEILKGSVLDTSKLQVTGTYTNDKPFVADADALVLGDFDATLAGDQILKITYLDQSVEHTVKVCAVTFLSVEGVPETLEAGAELDLADMKVIGHYNDNKGTTITLTEGITTKAFDNLTGGKTPLTVIYNGEHSNGEVAKVVEVNVNGSVLTSIEIQSYVEYIAAGREYLSQNVHVVAKFANDNTTSLPEKEYEIEINTSQVGDQTMTVTYRYTENGVEKTAQVSKIVKVLPLDHIEVTGLSNSAYHHAEFDTSKMIVKAIYSDGTYTDECEVDTATVTVTMDTSKTGEQKAIITYQNKTVEHPVRVYHVTEIRVADLALNIVEGKEIDFSTMKVYGIFNDAKKTEILLAEGVESTTISTEQKEQTLSITYSGKYGTIQKDLQVSVTDPEVSKIEIKLADDEVFYGTVYDKRNVTVIVTYTNDTTITLNPDFDTISDVDTSKVGEATLTVTYTYEKDGEEITLTPQVTVNVVGVASMQVVNNTIPSNLFKGQDTLNTTGLMVDVTYTNGDTDRLVEDQLTLGSFDSNVGGEQVLSITYLDKTIEHKVTIYEVTSLKVAINIPYNIYIGKEINLRNMRVFGIYNDSKATEIELTETEGISTNVSEINTDTAGNKTLTVMYSGMYGEATKDETIKIYDFDIEVNYDRLVGQTMTYNKDNVVVFVVDENGRRDKAVEGTYTVSDIITTEQGEQTLVVTYTENGVEKTKNLTVKVLPAQKIVVSGGIADIIAKGNPLDTSGVKVTVTFSDGTDTITSVVGTADGVEVSPPDTSNVGTKQLTVTYSTFNATFDYIVDDVVGATILSGTVSNGIRYGYEVDYSGLYLTLTYANGREEQVLASTLNGVNYEGTEAGSKKFTVKYKDFSSSIELNVVYVVKISALNNTIPAVVLQGGAGQTLSYDTFKLSVYYENGDVYMVPFSDRFITVDPQTFMIDSPGMKAIRITYNDGGSDSVPDLTDNPDTTDDDQAVYLSQGLQPFYTEVNIWVKGVEKVEIVGGVLDQVLVGKTLDTSNISVKVTYDDGSYIYVDRTNPNLEISLPDTSKAGDATLKVTFSGKSGTKPITVKDAQQISGLIFGALMPDHLVARDSYKKNYRDQENVYYVGDDNPYYFYLNVIQLDANDNIVEIDGKSVPTAADIYLLDGGERLLTGDELTSYVKFNSSDNSYDFTDAAIGKTFKLRIRPADSTSYVDAGSVTKEQIVQVVNGYNIYHAYELNIITNVEDHDVKNGSEGAQGALDQKTVATKFLAKYGITRPQNLAGIVLHGNLDIQLSDIPSDYVCKYKDKNGQEQLGLYDHLGIFSLNLTTTQKTFDIYGNYYSIYSYNIPPVCSKGYGGNPDDFSSSDLFKLKVGDSVFSSINTNIAANQMIFDEYQINIRDMSTRDNDPNSNDQTASDRHMRGIICFKVGDCVTNVTNVNVEAYQMTMLVEDANSTLNLNKVKFYNAWQGHLFLWNDNRFQRWKDNGNKDVETAGYARDVVVNIKESSLTKCGGPVIIAQNTLTDYKQNQGSGSYVNVIKSDIHTYVTGQEAWFVAVGQTQLAAQVRAMSGLIPKIQNNTVAPGHGYTATDKIQGVETVNMVMVTMGEGVNLDAGETYNATYVEDGVECLKMSRPDNKKGTHKNPALDGYKAQQPSAPIFQSSAGGTALSDGTSGCYGLETGAMGAPTSNFYAGNKITLYYIGCGIMVEYYHPSN